MKKIIKALKITSTLLFITVTFIACDKDFTTIESDIQGSQNFNSTSLRFPLNSYNNKLNAVQTNGLSSYLLGIYKDEIYGTTTASIVSQVTLSTYDPDFGDNAVIDSVMLIIPYYITTEVVGDENEYKIDSLFGETPINLSVYRNNYFLRDHNPENIEDSQKYYSNGNGVDFNGGTLLFQEAEYKPINEEIDTELSDEEENIITPSLYLNTVDLDFWNNLLKVDQSGSFIELSNSNNFKKYFRGLYFKAEPIPDNDGNLIMLDFSKAKIEVKYTNDNIDTDESITRERQTFQLNLNGNRINIFENNITNPDVINAYNNPNEIDGDEKLYVKGGEGSIAILDLFEGDITVEGVAYDAYDYFKSKKNAWLINEANLVFYVDETAGLVKEQEPDRVILYDIRNNVPIIDYFLDVSSTTNPEISKSFHATSLERNSDGNGVKYKIRLTEHLNNILLKDSTNLKLGLMVTTNINEIFQNSILNSENKVTSGTVMSPKGTVLHGSNENVAEAKRLQLEIFYTESEN